MKKKIALLGAVALLVSSFDQGLLLAAEQETDTQLVDVQDEEIFTDDSEASESVDATKFSEQDELSVKEQMEGPEEIVFEDNDSDLFSSGEASSGVENTAPVYWYCRRIRIQ